MWRIRIYQNFSPSLLNTLKDLSDVEHMIAVQAKNDAAPRVPARTGNLAASTQVVENRIIYPGPYAAPLYFGIRSGIKLEISTKVHPKAQTFWFWATKKDNYMKWKQMAASEIMRKIKR